MQLSVHSVALGLIAAVAREAMQPEPQWDWRGSLGESRVVWFVILLSACGGLLVALLMKQADNIVKGYATSAAVLVNSAFSAGVEDLQLGRSFWAGAVLVATSSLQYAQV